MDRIRLPGWLRGHSTSTARLLRALVSAALFTHGPALAQPDEISLFTTDAGPPAAADPRLGAESDPAPRYRIARVDAERLGLLRDEVVAGQSTELRLNLFDDVTYSATLERSTPTTSGFTLSGPLNDVPFGRVVLVVNGGKTYGRVYAPQGNWTIRTVGSMQTVEPLAPEPLRCGLTAEPMPNGKMGVGREEAQTFRVEYGGKGTDHAQGVTVESQGAGGVTTQAGRRGLGVGSDVESSPREYRAAPPATAIRPGAAGDDGNVVDVLVVYPSFARDFEGGYTTMLSMIDLDIATANEAYAASGVELQVRLAAAVEVEYDWFLDEDMFALRSGFFVSIEHWGSALEHLVNPDDGYLDEVHDLRDRYAADLVLLHLGGEATDRVAYSVRGPLHLVGLARRVNRVATEVLEESAFAVARSGDGTVVAHELGHSMGLHHDRYDDTANEPFPYSHGYVYEHAYVDPETGNADPPSAYGTIMSRYADMRQRGFVLAFSNPRLAHPQAPDLRLGVPGDEPSDAVDGPADATRHINEVRHVVANVRASATADSCRYNLFGDSGEVPAAGGTYRLRVETQSGCAWTAKAGEWVSSISDREGEGSGEVAYSVPANDYWKRSVEIMVSGQLHARSQVGTRPITPVCERSRLVEHALRVAHPDGDYTDPVTGYWVARKCEELNFDAEYLASVRTLDPGGRYVYRGVDGSELRPGDFDGLTGLYELWLNEVERIPTGTFAGLTGLRTLNLSQEKFWEENSATLRSIAPGAFRGLPGLKTIRIDGHRLRQLERGTFEGLEGLLGLRITEAQAGGLALEKGSLEGLSDLRVFALLDNGITALDSGLFDGLTALSAVNLFENEIRTLPEGVFNGLSRLQLLDLRLNRIEALRSGVFDGLSSLERLIVNGNRIAELQAGVFDGLTNLESLHLHYNRLARLPETALAPLARLKILELHQNRLTTIEPGTFGGLSELDLLNLGDNRLTRLEAGTFDGLTPLEGLWLANNAIRYIAPGTFEGLRVQNDLDLSNNQLGMLEAGTFSGLWASGLDLSHNRLGTLRVGTFRGIDYLSYIDLADNAISAFEPGVFEEVGRLDVRAGRNRIRELAPGALLGLSSLGYFKLYGNPGSPFTVAPKPVIAGVRDGAPGQPLEIALEIASAAPFDVRASFVVSGGSVSTDALTVSSGAVRSRRRTTVTPDGDGPVTVRMAGEPVLVTGISYPDACGSGVLIGPSLRACYSGFRLAAGPPLILYGIEDQSLVRGREAKEIELNEVFSYFVGTADYTVSTSDDAVASVRVADGMLTVTPGATGTAGITVTAEGMGGETLTRRFSVTVGVPLVPLFLSASNPAREGFVRVLNHSDKAGTVHITAIDDAGTRHGPVRLRLRPYGAAQFNSSDLEEGNETKRLLEGVGVGFVEGDWRLEFESDLDIEALSYVRTEDGFLTPIHDAAPFEGGVHRIATFNPASNVRQSSRLRVINTGREAADITVRGVDDAGDSPGGSVRFVVPAGTAREFDAMQLEAGDADLDGALGDGEGKWRLAVASDSPVVAMSLLENTSTSHLTNLSSAPAPPGEDGIHHVALFPAAGHARGRQGFARVINRSQEAGVVRIDAFDDAGSVYGALELFVEAGAVAHFNSDDLELGAAGKGLTGNTGAGEGDWRLELSSGLDIQVLAYVRTEDGFLTATHDAVAVRDGRRAVVLFNPATNTSQVSRLRFSNPHPEDVQVSIRGTDDTGVLPGGTAYVSVPARGAVTLSAAELEAGVPHPDLDGHWIREPLGDGRGKWRLAVVAEPGVLVQSLLESPTGHLTNVSSAPRMGAN